MSERIASPDFPRGVMSAKAREEASTRMRQNNPMSNPETAKKNGERFKARKESGELKLINGKWRRAL
jgi:uncharacterized protein YdbL (DUF1318 family)